MLIADEIKEIARRVGVNATGNTIPEVLMSFRLGLDAKEAREKAFEERKSKRPFNEKKK